MLFPEREGQRVLIDVGRRVLCAGVFRRGGVGLTGGGTSRSGAAGGSGLPAVPFAAGTALSGRRSVYGTGTSSGAIDAGRATVCRRGRVVTCSEPGGCARDRAEQRAGDEGRAGRGHRG